MGKILYSLVALVCLSVLVAGQPLPRPGATPLFPPQPNPACYAAQLKRDSNFDLSYVCNDGSLYPEREIEEALTYAEDHWRIYLNLTSTCFQEKDNFFMNQHTVKDFYYLKSVCKTRRTLVSSVYSQEGLVCHVVRPNEQKVYYAECGGVCNLGYDGVTGYHCIPKGKTQRKFLAYCHYPRDLVASTPLTCSDPVNGQYDPRTLPPTLRMQNMPLPDGSRYVRLGYFTEVNVFLPTYCGCRGYFCGY